MTVRDVISERNVISHNDSDSNSSSGGGGSSSGSSSSGNSNDRVLDRIALHPTFRRLRWCRRDDPDSVSDLRFSYGRHSRVRLRMRCARGGWGLVQNRGQFENPARFFDRGWSEYHRGFGDEEGEYWLGLANIQMLTATEPYELRVEVEDGQGNRKFAR